MMEIPKLDRVDFAFGNVKHLPKYDTLDHDFQNMSHPACRAVSMWFYKGAEANANGNGITIDGTIYRAKEGVDTTQALVAISAALRSFEPKHEHKIAGCGFMLNEWFEPVKAKAA